MVTGRLLLMYTFTSQTSLDTSTVCTITSLYLLLCLIKVLSVYKLIGIISHLVSAVSKIIMQRSMSPHTPNTVLILGWAHCAPTRGVWFQPCPEWDCRRLSHYATVNSMHQHGDSMRRVSGLATFMFELVAYCQCRFHDNTCSVRVLFQ